jgi:hypothetical protein
LQGAGFRIAAAHGRLLRATALPAGRLLAGDGDHRYREGTRDDSYGAK